MPNTMAIQDVQNSTDVTVIIFKVTLSGSYVQAVRGSNTGERFIPNSATNPNNKIKAFAGNKGFMRGYPIQGPGGFGCSVLPGADPFNWLLKLYGVTPGTELAAGAYAAGVTGDLDFLVAFEIDPTN
jgi:hypothetical protein